MEPLKTPLKHNDAADLDDAYAGKVLGWMLSLLFCYTIITSLYVIWWTWDSIRISQFQ